LFTSTLAEDLVALGEAEEKKDKYTVKKYGMVRLICERDRERGIRLTHRAVHDIQECSKILVYVKILASQKLEGG